MKQKTEEQIKKLNGVFFFDPTDRIYQSHFPERPVVPGSVILQAFLDILRQEGLFPEEIGIENFRFHDFIFPGDCDFSITVEGRQVNCMIYDGEKLAAKGKLML